MITLFRTTTQYTFADLKDAVKHQIAQLPEMIAPTGEPLKILRYEFPCEDIHLLKWIHNQTSHEKVYWNNRDERFEVAGLGHANVLQGEEAIDYQDLFHTMEDRLSSDNPHLRYYGGFSFSNDSVDQDWQPLGQYYFCVPQFELLKEGEHTVFACNIAVKDVTPENITRILDELEQINFDLDTTYRSAPKVVTRMDFPNEEQWKTIFSETSSHLSHDSLAKVVLARKSDFEFDKSIRPMALLKHLQDRTPSCYHFCFQMGDHYGFLGASPECLYKREGLRIESEALAGTNPRGKNDDEDNRLERELLNSEKDAQEHQFVVDEITTILNALCNELHVDSAHSLLKLQNWQHLITRFSGQLKQKVEDGQILKALHPTPAVAGSPTEKALRCIQNTESFPRGWYAAPVGYVGHDYSEFSVAIRSGLVSDNHLSLYAGAGIIEGSTEEDEWNEIENKISNFLKVFNGAQ